jgi:hypothetical protein
MLRLKSNQRIEEREPLGHQQLSQRRAVSQNATASRMTPFASGEVPQPEQGDRRRYGDSAVQLIKQHFDNTNGISPHDHVFTVKLVRYLISSIFRFYNLI